MAESARVALCTRPIPAVRGAGTRCVTTRYKNASAVEAMAEFFVRGAQQQPSDITKEESFAENFVSHADRIRWVNDLDKAQHLAFLEKLVSSDAPQKWTVNDAVYAVDEDGSNAFTLHSIDTGVHPLSIVLRFTTNDDGQIVNFWRKRSLMADEADALTKNAAAVHTRLKGMPQLHLQEMQADPCREAAMLSTIDSFFQEFRMHSARDEERWDRISAFTTDDFCAWDASGAWTWPSGCTGVLDREGLMREINCLDAQDFVGHPCAQSRAHAAMRAKAANSASNVGFLHLDVMGSGMGGPFALDAIVAFTFTNDGSKIRQALLLRSAMSIQEYASVFKMANDISNFL